MTDVAGRTNKRLPRRDPHGLFQAACNQFADDYGWRRQEIWDTFQELALMREYESRIPRALAEHFALQDIYAVFMKAGSEAC